jgi:hypothetical protein
MTELPATPRAVARLVVPCCPCCCKVAWPNSSLVALLSLRDRGRDTGGLRVPACHPCAFSRQIPSVVDVRYLASGSETLARVSCLLLQSAMACAMYFCNARAQRPVAPCFSAWRAPGVRYYRRCCARLALGVSKVGWRNRVRTAWTPFPCCWPTL